MVRVLTKLPAADQTAAMQQIAAAAEHQLLVDSAPQLTKGQPDPAEFAARLLTENPTAVEAFSPNQPVDPERAQTVEALIDQFPTAFHPSE
jgi:hypothetical protein